MQQAKYQVHAFCNRCKGIHNMYVGKFRLDARSPKKETVADTFVGKEIPPNIAALTNTKFICPNAKRFTLQKDSNQIFLVPFLETDQGVLGSKDQVKSLRDKNFILPKFFIYSILYNLWNM